MIEKQLGLSIKAIQTNNAREFIHFDKFLAKFGIIHHYTCPYSHPQNGTVERKHIHIVETGLSFLAHASISLKYWDFAFKAATLVINNLPTSILQYKTPHEILYHHPPKYELFRVFGCTCFPLLRSYNKHKFDFKSHACLFLGYSVNKKGYLCLHPNGKLYTSMDVIFNENEFPYKCVPNMFAPQSSAPVLGGDAPSSTLLLLPTTPHQPHTPVAPSDSFVPCMPSPSSSSEHPSVSEDAVSQTQDSPHSIASLNSGASQAPTSTDSVASSSADTLVNVHPMQTRAKSGIFKPKAWVSTTTVPLCAQDALIDPAWKQAMQVEFDALLKNKTWTLVQPPRGAHIITSKWIFKNKYNPDGTLNDAKHA